MTTHYKTKAFVFRKNDRNESDRVFSVFTNDFGRLDVFAKAIRKSASKLRGGIDIFSISEIEFIQGKNKKTLTEAIKIEKFNNIFQNLERFKIASKIGEVIDNFIKGEEKDKEIFNLLNETFIKLNNYKLLTTNYQLIYYYFLWNIFSLLGYHPQVQKCNVCQEKLNEENIYFSYKLGGTVCDKCFECDLLAQKINSDIVKILRLIYKKEWQVISKLKVNYFSQNLLEDVSQKAMHSFCPL